MSYEERIELCTKIIQNYTEDEFELFCAEMGWADWMCELCEYGCEDRTLYASELYDIYLVQKDLFLQAFPNAKIKDKILADFT